MLESLASGIHKIESLPGLGRFSISIPDRGDQAGRAPLILALHWGVEIYPFVSHDFLAGFVQPDMGDSGACIIAPDRRSDTWDDPEQEATLLQMVDRAVSQLGLDPRRVAITGYSMGGIGSWHIAARHAHLFSALIPIACNPPASAMNASWQIPIYVIHGEQDELFPLSETRRCVEELEKQGVPIRIRVVEQATHFAAHLYVDALRKAVSWVGSIWEDPLINPPPNQPS